MPFGVGFIYYLVVKVVETSVANKVKVPAFFYVRM